MSTDTTTLLSERLAILQPKELEIEDQSHLHVGHAGAGGGKHLKLTIVADAFAGKNTMARHRLVYEAAGDLMRGPIHALVIRALAPDEV